MNEMTDGEIALELLQYLESSALKSQFVQWSIDRGFESIESELERIEDEN